jgi:hypothetical protein
MHRKIGYCIIALTATDERSASEEVTPEKAFSFNKRFPLQTYIPTGILQKYFPIKKALVINALEAAPKSKKSVTFFPSKWCYNLHPSFCRANGLKGFTMESLGSDGQLTNVQLDVHSE